MNKKGRKEKEETSNIQLLSKNKGITLIALVSTIIIALILTAITMNLFLGNGGLFEYAAKGIKETQKAKIGEKVKVEVYLSYDNAGKLSKEKIKENVRENLGVLNPYIKDTKDGGITFPYEDYRVKVDEDGTVHVEEWDEAIPPDLSQSDIKFRPEPSTWTNTVVKVGIEITKAELGTYEIQYATEDPKTEEVWKYYKEPIEVEKNETTIWARLVNGRGESGGFATTTIQNIDTLAPTSVTFTTTNTSNSITVNADATDAPADTSIGSGSSGIKLYYYSKDGGSTWEPTAGTDEKTHAFSGLTQNKGYEITVKAEDQAENSKAATKQTITTGKVTDLTTSNTTIAVTPSGWTKNAVTIEITTEAELGVSKLQYRIGASGNWTDYTKTFTVENNGTVIQARLWDGTNEGETTSKTIENIDKLEPNSVTFSTTTKSNSITVNADATDAPADTSKGSGSSGIKLYYYSKDGGSTWEPAAGTDKTNYTFSGLTQNQGYSINVKAEDQATNSKVGTATTATTGRVTDLTTSNTTIGLDPTGWTKGSVTVSITTTASLGAAKLQYRIGASGAWTDYTKTFTVADNGTVIQARLWDGTNEGATTSKTIDNIDKLEPDITLATSGITDSTVTLTVNGDDKPATSTSGKSKIKNYAFYLGSTLKTTLTTNSYTYTDLKGETKYTLKVIVTDNAGNTTTKTVDITTDVSSPIAGDYVNYTPTSGSFNITTAMSGYTSSQTLKTENLQWRVWSIDEKTGIVKIVPATPVPYEDKFYLRGANGYNHGVDILNDACKALYSKGKAIAKSMTVEDILEKIVYDPNSDSSCPEYGLTKPMTNKNYPKIYLSELGSTSKGFSDTNSALLKQSDGVRNADGSANYTKYSGSSWTSTLYVTYNSMVAYPLSKKINGQLGVNTIPKDMFDALQESMSFLATRSAGFNYQDYSIAHFAMYTVAFDQFYTGFPLYMSDR